MTEDKIEKSRSFTAGTTKVVIASDNQPVFFNFTAIAASQHEVILYTGVKDIASNEVVHANTVLVMTPHHAKELLEALKSQLRVHEETYGVLNVCPAVTTPFK